MQTKTVNRPVRVKNPKKFVTQKSTYNSKLETLRRKEVRKLKKSWQ